MDRQEFERLRQSVRATLPQRHARTKEESLAAIREAQAIMMELVPRDRLLVDEWLQEKRAESEPA
jgi:hypothetical protein